LYIIYLIIYSYIQRRCQEYMLSNGRITAELWTGKDTVEVRHYSSFCL